MDRFSFRSLPLRPVAPASAGASAPERALEIVPLTIASGVSAGERSGGELQALLDGDYSTVEHVDNELRWQAIGGCPVPFRGSVMRVVLFKLLGTGIFAAITAVGSDDPLTTKSCALCAAINTVAIVHYFFSNAHTSNSRALSSPPTRQRRVRSLAHPPADAQHHPDGAVDGAPGPLPQRQRAQARARRHDGLRERGLQAAGLPKLEEDVRAGDCGRQLAPLGLDRDAGARLSWLSCLRAT